MNLGDLNKVCEIKALKRKPGEEEAKMILERIAKQVQPIMRKHKWRVKLLSEFCPSNSRLLGLNVGGGVHVKLRLRRPNRDLDFFPYDQILDTMLHELCHNAHGPHNANFYKLWDELRKECEELMSNGITGTGQGFDLPGKRLGGFSIQPPVSSLRKSAVAAAEKRARLGSLLPSGPKRLGGDSTIMVALSPIQAAAMAAERRLQDDIWCGSSSQEVSVDECGSNIPSELLQTGQSSGNLGSTSNTHGMDAVSQKRNLDSEHSNSLDLPVEVSTSGSTFNDPSKSRKLSHISDNTSSTQSCPDVSGTSTSLAPNHNGIFNRGRPAQWGCGTCTLLNPPLAPLCELCGTQKPKDVETKYKFWSCKFCTLENSIELEKCSACAQWRYSHGPPVSVRGPNIGT